MLRSALSPLSRRRCSRQHPTVAAWPTCGNHALKPTATHGWKLAARPADRKNCPHARTRGQRSPWLTSRDATTGRQIARWRKSATVLRDRFNPFRAAFRRAAPLHGTAWRRRCPGLPASDDDEIYSATGVVRPSITTGLRSSRNQLVAVRSVNVVYCYCTLPRFVAWRTAVGVLALPLPHRGRPDNLRNLLVYGATVAECDVLAGKTRRASRVQLR